MKEPYQIILRPLVTEKGTAQVTALNKYAFSVHPSANKNDIKQAVEAIFKVKVTAVNTMNRKGKKKRVRMAQGLTSAWKKAVVTLKTGDKIEVLG